ncbi:hypothetical protein [Lyngbya sp. PCC 8106]|uniref:hypothetical protein n=1 Tax=Lyngbya sp. (strain PCC 8106) TaxID=313612 RepID=UPI0000EAA02C|nr:hypothetical protein [Lyngbya sp. PCC 8106]EAW34594.1 hypothetical protein L8106_14255 [Lyngbya sp. PCC 8106]
MNIKSIAKTIAIVFTTLISIQTPGANAEKSPFYWSYMGESMGKKLYLDVSMYSIRLYDKGETLFTYKIGDEMVYAKSHCRTWQWYILGVSNYNEIDNIRPPSAIDNGNLSSIYDAATDEMMMRVCTAASMMSIP